MSYSPQICPNCGNSQFMRFVTKKIKGVKNLWELRKETDPFTLVAPKQKGIYEVAFRLAKAASEGTALQSWNAHDENGWGEPVTLGLLIVL